MSIKGFKFYGWAGLCIIILAEILLFTKVKFIGWFFTPLVWTGYILFIDSLVFKLKKESWLTTRHKEFIVLTVLSIFFWYIFEFYNMFLDNWHYVGLPENKLVQYFGYFWSFATIWPAIFETAELLQCLKPFKDIKIRARKISNAVLASFLILGLMSLTLPVVFPSPYLIILVWINFILFLEPINYWWGEKSLLRDWENGELSRLAALLASGGVCGFLWEYWNYGATAKWIYTVPFWSDVKIFEMPVVGYLGFLPFACECYVMYNFTCGIWHKISPQSRENVPERKAELLKQNV